MRALQRVVALTLLLLAITTAPALADEVAIPPRPEDAAAYSDLIPLYDAEAYPYTAYTWDGEQWSTTGYAATYTGLNLLLTGKAWFLKVALRLTEWATEPSLTADLFEALAEPAQAIGDSLWDLDGAPLVASALAVAGTWALLLYLRGRRTRAWGALGATALVLLLAATALPSGARIAATLGETGDGLATALLLAVPSDEPLLAQAGDGVWRRLVHEPWLEGELSADGAERYVGDDGLPGGQFLAMDGAQRRAACLFDGEVDCPTWSVEFLPQRLLSALATGGMALAWGSALLLLSGGLLLARLTLAALLLLAPVWLLVALWLPMQSLGWLQRIASLAIGAVVKQFLLAAGLLLFLLLSVGLQALLSEFGWPLPGLLLGLLGAGAMRYRYAWFRPLAAPPERSVRAPIPRQDRGQLGVPSTSVGAVSAGLAVPSDRATALGAPPQSDRPFPEAGPTPGGRAGTDRLDRTGTEPPAPPKQDPPRPSDPHHRAPEWSAWRMAQAAPSSDPPVHQVAASQLEPSSAAIQTREAQLTPPITAPPRP